MQNDVCAASDIIRLSFTLFPVKCQFSLRSPKFQFEEAGLTSLIHNTNSVGASPGPISSKHKCDVETTVHKH